MLYSMLFCISNNCVSFTDLIVVPSVRVCHIFLLPDSAGYVLFRVTDIILTCMLILLPISCIRLRCEDIVSVSVVDP
jgi:hypothetical protein